MTSPDIDLSKLSSRAWQLHRAVKAAASSLDEQLMLILVHARRIGASEAEVRAVRALLVKPVKRECRR